MKKTLNTIFDEANAGEIENLVKQNAAPDVSADTFSSIKDKVYAKTNLKKEKKTNKNVWLRFGAIAACFLLIVSAAIVVPLLRDDNTVNSKAPFPAPNYYGSEATLTEGLPAEINDEGFSVIARLIAVLPDTYTFYDDWSQTEFHLLKMETVTLLRGKNMTDTFYYIVPERYMTDYTIYDSFAIDNMAQYGYDYTVLYNKTQNCAEQLDTVLFGYLCDSFDYMGSRFMAFDSKGNFDGRLWGANEYWAATTGWPNNLIGQPNKYLNGYTIDQAKQDLYYDDSKLSVSLIDSVSEDAKDALKYIQSFNNGLYIPSGDGFKAFHSDVQLSFRKYIGGFATNESGTIYADRVKWSKAKFSKNDENALPDLQSAYSRIISSFENGEILPPHIQNHQEMKNTANGIFGWYAKTEDGILGIVRISWCYRSNEFNIYFDDAYYIVEYGSDEFKAIDRDSLLERLGEYETSYIYDGEYDELGIIYDYRNAITLM